MATQEFPLNPVKVPRVETRYRRIVTEIPVPQSIPLLQRLREQEPRSMGGQPPILWHHGKGATISDPYGNTWIDFSSGVLVTACGHAHPEIVKAITDMASQGLYHAYCFPTEIRLKLIEELSSWLPAPLKRVFLLTTGSEACECCIKLARTQGLRVGGPEKKIFVSFDNGFHGRTMGSQLAGGSPALKAWLGKPDPSFVQVPFPDGFRQKDVSFAAFEKALQAKGVNPDDVCGVMAETYQGCNATIMPAAFAQELRRWCDRHKVVMIFDEVQAGFGRTGTPFGFTHTGVVPDLAACGKGIAGGMPLAAVLGTEELMSLYGPGEMTSTHSANPICCAAALANLQVIRREKLIDNAARLAPVLAEGMRRISKAAGNLIGHVDSIGLVGCAQFTKPGTTEPAPQPAWEMVRRAVERGVMLFAPVGIGGCAVKINPPLVIPEQALREGLDVLETIARELAAEQA
ncbi:aspartate aminotransferase family protein [Fontivita pretiosa]|uniref:aspartate aminotransferase family protein n=1 Tax=Fontivita pretiosa TaxID=2989684 RepID=UPI003D16B8CF